MTSKQDSLKRLPSVSSLLENEQGLALSARVGKGIATFFIRQVLAEQREIFLNATTEKNSLDRSTLSTLIIKKAESKALRTEVGARRAINATGVLLHTGLGRAPLSGKPLDAIKANAAYGVVQVNLEDNTRSLREKLIQELLSDLIGAEAATTMNNNAAATFMLLHVLAAGKEVIVSRGQLVEIGGSYRMPDVMEQSGALLKEVGTTNKTHLADYERAINENTGAILYVEPSNYVVQGFASMPSVAELATLTKPRGIPLIADIGSGALDDLSKYGFKDISCLKQALADGADVTCSSGDKLLGGPQAGIICGTTEVVSRVRKSPFARMFRTDKLTLAGVEATLLEFVNGTEEENIPLYRMFATTLEQLELRAKAIQKGLEQYSSCAEVTITEATSFIGGGSLPSESLASLAVGVKLLDSFRAENSASESKLAKALRLGRPPVFCRVQEGKAFFDMRTLLEGDTEILISSISEALETLKKK